MLEIHDLHVAVGDKEILKGVSLTLKQGEVHALMGPNGSGKSTLSYAIMGHPKYTVTKGSISLDGKNVLEMPVNERAKAGLFLSFQYPSEIAGVGLASFLRTAYNERTGSKIGPMEFMKTLYEKMALLKMDKDFAKRNVNVGFSGGEKKRNEILQMAVLSPKYTILDETDSGLDVDSLKIVSEGVNALSGPNMGVLIITHYQRILNYIAPDFVHVLVNGKIVKSGGKELALHIEQHGYDKVV
ncbi:MAG: Fe-S cluster assembly ATPase SufC [Nanoarchaeota archaeon]|nr:Fe-S cluster assembly ATPase SufC [Nanoarchaeota archaeon]